MNPSGRPGAVSSASVPHVLMTADTVGGVWTYALDLADGYAQRGFRTTLAIFGPARDDVLATVAAIPGVAALRTGQPLDWMAETPEDVRQASRALRDLCADLAPDVVHLNAPALALNAPLGLPTVGVCHSCLETWWSAVRGGEPPGDFAWRTTLLRQGLRSCDTLLAPTAAFAATTEFAHGVPRPLVVHNGRPPPRTDPASEAGRFVFTAGRLWDDGKNVALIDEAARLSGIETVAAGPLRGPAGPSVSYGSLRTLGPLAPREVHAWLSRRPVFVSASLYEPFGLSVLEAAQAACPLVLSDIPTFRELWEDAALFFDPHQPEALADLMRRLADAPEVARKLGDEARRRSHAYDAAAMVEATLAAYAGIAPAFAAQAEAAA